MKKNSGMTIIEIILSICIIAIVLVLLFTMLIQVRHQDDNNNIQSNFIINQSTFIKAVEEDIVNYGVKSIGSCTLADANISTSVVTGYEDDYKCVRIEYAADYIQDKVGYLIIYNYYTKYDVIDGEYQGYEPSWMVQYVRGSYGVCNNGRPQKTSWVNATSLMRELPSEVDLSETPYVLYTAMDSNRYNAASVVIPIVNLEGEHYDINLSFTFQGNSNFTCGEKEGSLECICTSSDALCAPTKNNYSRACT